MRVLRVTKRRRSWSGRLSSALDVIVQLPLLRLDCCELVSAPLAEIKNERLSNAFSQRTGKRGAK